MDTMRITEDGPTKLVLEKALSPRAIWHQWNKTLLYPLLAVVVPSIFLLIGLWSHLTIPALLYWAIGIGILIEAFVVYIFLASGRNTTVTIDLQTNIATRVEKLVSGREKKTGLALREISRILIHSEELGHSTRLLLDSENRPALEIMNSSDLLRFEDGRYIPDPSAGDGSGIDSLETLGRKIGELLKKPVIARSTDSGKLQFEKVIQP